MADSFGQLGERAASVAKLCAATSGQLAASFEAPLKECVRTVGAVKKVMADRSAALQAYQAVSGGLGRGEGRGEGRAPRGLLRLAPAWAVLGRGGQVAACCPAGVQAPG